MTGPPAARTPAVALALVALVLATAAATPAPAQAQSSDALTVTAGAAGGVVSGVVVTLGWVVERAAIEQQYLHDATDLVGLLGTPLLVMPAAGVTLAVIDPDMLRAAGVGAGVGVVAGAAGGVVLGHVIAGGQEGRWAGGIMGAAAGLLAGAAFAATTHALAADDHGPADLTPSRVPVGFTLRF